MKKLGLLFKEVSGNRIKDKLAKADTVFVVKYSGLSGPELNMLRQSLSDFKVNLFVVRNTIAKRILKSSQWEGLSAFLNGPCGFIFVNDDPANASKVLYAFSKEHEKLRLEGGFLKERLLEKKDIEALAKMPSKETLRAQVTIGLKAPITGIVMVLSQTLKKFVICLDQIKKKKETGS
ncbi:MAG: 50S ribosomal protein L10 [Candidatus Omnitrophota bacterium]|jgi:large subunit ribosomal protein L10|nr:MAG: 50S ribosomal protein L10 [Candidatus Omnitrophota bacterium]